MHLVCRQEATVEFIDRVAEPQSQRLTCRHLLNDLILRFAQGDRNPTGPNLPAASS